jgi:hypothetical protein
MSISTAPPKIVSKFVTIAPLIIAISALIGSFAQWKPASVDKKILDEITITNQQIVELKNSQVELNKQISLVQIEQSAEISRRKVLAELRYSAEIIEARMIKMRYGTDVSEKFLLNRKRIYDEILRVETSSNEKK